MRLPLSVALIFLLARLAGAQPAAPEDDFIPRMIEVEIGADEPEIGRVVEATGNEIQLQWDTEYGAASRSVPTASILSLRVAEPENYEEALESASPADVGKLEAAWKLWRPTAGLSGSPAIAIGNRLAVLLVEDGKLAGAQRVYEELGSVQLDSSLREEARASSIKLRFEMADAAGKEELARKLVEQEKNPRLLCLAHYALAEAAAVRYADFVEENPRWEDDPPAIEEHDSLYQSILNDYLYAVALYANIEDASARGILATARFHLDAGEKEEAASDVRLLLEMYPAAPETAEAKELMPDVKVAEREKAPPKAEAKPQPKPKQRFRKKKPNPKGKA